MDVSVNELIYFLVWPLPETAMGLLTQPLPKVCLCVSWGGILIIIHGRSRMNDHRPSYPYNAGTEKIRFSPTTQTMLAPSANKKVGCWASCMKACKAALHMDISVNELIYFLVWPLPETAMGLLCNCLVGALPYTLLIGDTIIPPLCGVKLLHPAQK